ncbi:PREDICTED: sentrin-specific protease 2-like, partial [Eurypyga helias]|uniref:sentrin-specific protease 2-like n=1 Tax=Eurypyga helias TaxID=54383 RepID=UPI000528CC6F
LHVVAKHCSVCSFLSVGQRVQDPHVRLPKRRRTDYSVSEHNETVKVSAVATLPAKARSEGQKASDSYAAPIAESVEKVNKMPCGTSTCLNRETLFLSQETVPYLSVQSCYLEPVMTVTHLEDQKYSDFYPCMTLRTSITYANGNSPQWPQSGDKIRYYTPVGNLYEQGKPVKQATAGLPVIVVEEEEKFPSSENLEEHFPQFTQAMEREVVAALGKGDPDEVLSSAFKLKVTRADIHTLRSRRWLNDEVINFYMSLLVERNKKNGYPAVHAFSTFFYPKLISGGYNNVRRWTRGVDLFKMDLILVPVHLETHWTLVVIDVKEKTVRYFDSAGQDGDSICQTLLQYLKQESQEKRNLELISSEWTIHSMQPHEIPQQMNGSDCGVFVCKYADFISQEKPMTFTQSHMPYFRKMMVWEIIHQQLL